MKKILILLVLAVALGGCGLTKENFIHIRKQAEICETHGPRGLDWEIVEMNDGTVDKNTYGINCIPDSQLNSK